ncbi:MAG TPA: AAA family ATPase [Saprospiraceae bacterium]|nr:AAA family ATPase [Saprospiraceae bacterium]
MEESTQQQPETRAYKFKELKVYASTEWLADNKKKYRQVYDRLEASYVYAELSFFNKHFDVESWDVEVTLRCLSMKRAGKELCRLQIRRNVSKYDSIVYIREGWGNKKEGSFWKKGAYCWEAFIDNEKVGSKYFYVEESDTSFNGLPRYLSLQSLRLYEGQYDDVGEDDRHYYIAFSSAETRYIYSEVVFQNLQTQDAWQCELFTKFYNEARELKGQVTRLQTIKKGDEKVKVTAGWGSNVKGSWRKGKYTAEIVFMDRLVAVVPFEVGEDFKEGNSQVLLPDYRPAKFTTEDTAVQSLEEVMVDLNAMIGLQEIKKQVYEHAQYLQFLQLRKENGFAERQDINIHSVFVGNPGTGKTTVASMMGKLYKNMGLLTKGHVHQVDRVDLVGEYIGQTAPKTKDAIEKARGGVLFIDEAYSLARANDDTKDFGREVIEILVKEMSNGQGDMAVIVAGYPKEMKYFLDSNPGLKSRFKIHYHFTDYLPQDLSEIGMYACKDKEVVLSHDAKKLVDEMIIEAYRNRDRTFGNARFVNDLIEKAKVSLGLRVMNSSYALDPTRDDLSIITAADIEHIKLLNTADNPTIPVDEKLLTLALADLNALTGLDGVKKQIEEMVDIVRYHQVTGRSVLNKFYMHTVFIGNPGTGKTTVARILTRIYKALGILERGHMVETDRQGLVAGYVGQTALKTAEKIEEAMGGVLFIDEAYALSNAPGNAHDFGNEVIQTILKRMEDKRGQFFVFAAGYPENMEAFLKANPGLSSRFDKILRFEDYSPAELNEIAMSMITGQEMRISPKALEHLTSYFKFLYDYRDKYFGNARSIRQIVQDVIKNQNLRLAKTNADAKSQTNLITFEDVKDFARDKNLLGFQRQTIGYRKNS